MLSGVALKRAKANTYFSSEDILQAFYEAKALSRSAKITSSGEANAPCVSSKVTSQAFF